MRIIFLIEHKKRELKYCNLIANRIKQHDESIDIKFLSIKFDGWRLGYLKCDILFVPFIDSLKSWPFRLIANNNKMPWIINLGWEQELHAANKRAKLPKDEFCLQKVTFVSWSSDYKEFLKSAGVASKNILSVHNYNRVILETIRNKCFVTKNNIKKFNLFLPLNFTWVFLGKEVIRSKVKHGYGQKNAEAFYDYSLVAFDEMSAFLKNVGNRPEYSLIIRPHPYETIQDYKKHFDFNNILITDQHTALDYIPKSDAVVSNWSSVVLDANQLVPFVGLLMPDGKPDFFTFSWSSEVNILHDHWSLLNQLENTRQNLPQDKIIFKKNPELKNEFDNYIDLISGFNGSSQTNLYLPIGKLILLKALSIKPTILSFLYSLCYRVGFHHPIRRFLADYLK